MTTLVKRKKARVRRRDCEHKRNIHRNKPLPRQEVEQEILKPVLDKQGNIKMKNGRAVYGVIGKKTISQKLKRKALTAGDGILPTSKKYRLSKKTLAEQKKAKDNAFQTATNN